ncbi:DENN domain-containing protein 2A-like [Acipenser ruthenus]|uniref:DENN domain-containing protein 2A-like n=1 Tax=Acipenser ruthenus TaxID=7906 RepID=UPI00274290A4|nr:DENN domain-containing protein 2A-like [Acipenser ruthenus]XP_058882907.1 DENN domain-containing protein 2A-like [Acipenser ruthenus]XP_058882908.1 DENN domain-containing protein 2A-like [Acipenser ruthenus]
MPVANTMTAGRAVLVGRNFENCNSQSIDRLQFCGVKRGEILAAIVLDSGLQLKGETKTLLTSLDNLTDAQERTTMLTQKHTGADHQASENGLTGSNKFAKKLPANKLGLKSKASIRDKISQWEGKKEVPSPLLTRKEPETAKKEEIKTSEVRRGNSRRFVGCEKEDPGKENSGKTRDLRSNTPQAPVNRECKLEKGISEKLCANVRDNKSVLTHIKKLEQALKEGPSQPQLVMPGNYFCPAKEDEAKGWERRPTEPIFGTLEVVRPGSRTSDQENVYTEPGTPSINPLPKPQRTFQHDGPGSPSGTAPGLGRGRRNLPPLPSIPPPPLPTCPPPSISRRAWADRHRNNANRKSYEFEDVLQSSTEGCQVDWNVQSKLSLTRTLSEENVYEDILDPPSKENPYEDIETESRGVGNKCILPRSPPFSAPGTPTKLPSKPSFFRQNSERRSFKLLDLRKTNREGACSPSIVSPPSTPSSPDDTPCLSGDPNNRRRRKIPKLVLKINGIYEARRGKKRMKRVSQSTESSSGKVTDENSESESDTEEKLKAHSQRLVHVQSMLKQTGHYHTQERDLLDLLNLQERKLFEYFLVVALHKKQAGLPYLPEVTQQFPLKLERGFKFMRETEDQLKVIPQFCFPDARDWAPVQNFASETFSFVLTGEDGSRRFGYCRRLLPSGKGRRLPEVYCIVSRLGCFDLFSKILDEVEKRRAISPALVQPFMRSIMEAPFPAPGRTITVKNFLPGSGTEVIMLCRPLDSRLEHVDFECLFSSLNVRLLVRVFASLLLERRVIFTADKLSTLSQCCHAVVAMLYPFAWQHTYIPVLPPSMIDIVCTPTPFIVGLLSSSLPQLKELPIEEVLVVDLCNNRFLRQMDDEDSILPHKLQAALEHVLEKRKELACEKGEPSLNDSSSLSVVVSEAIVRFFVEMVGHYSLFLGPGEREDEGAVFHRDAFRKAISSKSLRRFLEVFMETQMFAGFIHDQDLRRQGLRGLFELRAQDYLDSLRGSEQSGVNKFLKGLGNKMKFLSKK